MGSDPNGQFARFHGLLIVGIPKRQFFLGQYELHAPRLTRSQRDLFKTLQLTHGTSDTVAALANVKLDHFLARTFASILDDRIDHNLVAVRQVTALNLFRDDRVGE